MEEVMNTYRSTLTQAQAQALAAFVFENAAKIEESEFAQDVREAYGVLRIDDLRNQKEDETTAPAHVCDHCGKPVESNGNEGNEEWWHVGSNAYCCSGNDSTYTVSHAHFATVDGSDYVAESLKALAK
jgi:hypothetical protein